MESHDDGTGKCYFPSAVGEATHDKWTVRQILVQLGLFSEIKSLRVDVTEFHARQGIVLTDVEITSFYSLRPDGVAFDDRNKHCVLLRTSNQLAYMQVCMVCMYACVHIGALLARWGLAAR